MNDLSHTDNDGNARMVDISQKKNTSRSAVVQSSILLNQNTFALIRENKLAKGGVLTVAKIAGIQAAKKTSELIPLCHPVNLSHIDITFELDDINNIINITTACKTDYSTGVEMEAFVGCSIAAVTIYDMIKSVQKDAVISEIKLISKKGGKSGEFIRKDP